MYRARKKSTRPIENPKAGLMAHGPSPNGADPAMYSERETQASMAMRPKKCLKQSKVSERLLSN